MAITTLLITGFVRFYMNRHTEFPAFKQVWDADPAAFKTRIRLYVPEFRDMQFGPEETVEVDGEENIVVKVEIDFQIEPSIHNVFTANGEPNPSSPPYGYDELAKLAAGTLLERVLWIPQVAPRISGVWYFKDYGITSYKVDGTVVAAQGPGAPGGDGGTKGG